MDTDFLLTQILTRCAYPGITFIYNREFFYQTKIGQIRWGQIIRKEKKPSLNEIESLCKVFRIDFLELIKYHS